MKLLTSIGLADVGITVNGVLDGVFRDKRWSKYESEIMDWNNTREKELKLLTLVGLAYVRISVYVVPEGGFRGKRLS